MAKDSLSALPLWEQFRKAAQERRRNPVRLLTDYMRECLEIWEDQQLDEQIRLTCNAVVITRRTP